MAQWKRAWFGTRRSPVRTRPPRPKISVTHTGKHHTLHVDIPTFQNTILAWHRANPRDMPWRRTHDPYRILVSEVMLHQTQVARVIPKYHLFLSHFPDVNSLAEAPQNKLLEIWQGLGYWRRALFLKKCSPDYRLGIKRLVPIGIKDLTTSPRCRTLYCFSYRMLCFW